ncbi:MAG TPA: Flp pilus assembly protein CpaB, partial [Bacillota bacterium]
MRWQGLLVLAIAAGLLAATFTYRYLGRFGEAVPVVVAARDLPAPLRLTEGDLRLEPMPLPLVHRLAFTDVGALVGRYLLYPAAAGQVLLDPQLARPGADGPVSARLAPNTVAFFVPLPADRALGGAVGEG